MKRFGENLKTERQNAGFSQKEFALILGTTQQRISEWETNKVEPTLSNIIAIIKTLNISFEDLIEDD
ncbi:MAG: helix-turn-helix domain-containing protein [Clostridia bacterium]|nr:helix-turn-helix domain-containing protein [Clostridia bacterium]